MKPKRNLPLIGAAIACCATTTQYQLSHSLSIGAAGSFLWSGDMPVDQGTDLSLRGRVSGAFEDAWFAFANLNLTWKF